MIKLSTRLTRWYELSICEAQNFEERVAIYARIVDILFVSWSGLLVTSNVQLGTLVLPELENFELRVRDRKP